MSTFLFVILLWMGFTIWQERQDIKLLREKLSRFNSLISTEEFKEDLERDISEKEHKIKDLKNEKESLEVSITKLRNKLSELDDRLYVQSLDFYEPKYSFISSNDYMFRLRQLGEERKRLKERGRDYICYKDIFITRNNGQEKKIKISKNITQLMKIAFETECKYTIQKVSLSNLESSEAKIRNLFKRINRQSGKVECLISDDLLELKLKELTLSYELEEKKREEKELRKIKDEQVKDMKRAEKAKQKLEEAEDKERRYQEKLDAALEKQSSIAAQEKEKLEREVSELQKLLSQAHSETEEAKNYYQKAMTKEGFIYVLSNIGSLGKDIHRICRTQSNPPERYIDPMNRSVPFPFDVHIKLFSRDSLGTLQQLHQRFCDKRLNLVNDYRKDFFEVPLNEIIQAVEEIDNETGLIAIEEVINTPYAYEYMRSQALVRHNQKSRHSSVHPIEESQQA